jgi:hypothetical protein
MFDCEEAIPNVDSGRQDVAIERKDEVSVRGILEKSTDDS